ncbi:uncharacterized protein LOC117177937 [Belonocnema kinseyi]|uniref:uncharacterized protein LOC117177937 n=1 Tax=Belonocnema kinseyi TaxID=2817044 RepID=UPI00143DA4C9|nr:uncharacterized protein LOC117177937 [Belonocnema kinseyi]
MPGLCVAFGCNNKGGHRFPTDKKLREQWTIAIKREGFRPSSASRVCSSHFSKEDYCTVGFETNQILERKILKKGAVPTVFSWKMKLGSFLEVDRSERKDGSRKRIASCLTAPCSVSYEDVQVPLKPTLSSSSEDIHDSNISIGFSIEVKSAQIDSEAAPGPSVSKKKNDPHINRISPNFPFCAVYVSGFPEDSPGISLGQPGT